MPVIRRGLQIPNFSFPGVEPGDLFETVASIAALLLGDPDTVGEVLQTRVLGAGLDGVIVNLPADAHARAASSAPASCCAA